VRRLLTAGTLLLGSGWMSKFVMDDLGIEGVGTVAVPVVIGFAAGFLFSMGVFRR
jgi:hypothetical protein